MAGQGGQGHARRGDTPAGVAVSLWALAVTLSAVAVVFVALNGATSVDKSSGSPVVDGLLTVLGLTFPTVGLVIALRRPGHAVGWLFLAAGVGGAVEDASLGWAIFGLETDPGALPGGAVAGLVADVVWVPILTATITLLFLVFPDGRLPTDRWRWLTYLVLVDLGVYVVGTTVNPGPLYYFPAVDNPLGIGAIGPVAQALVDVVGYGVPFLVIASGVALVQRFRASRGLRRQQMKWLAYAAGLLAASFPVLVTIAELDVTAGDVLVSEVLFAGLIGLIPIAVGAAILRHRLYDIDVVVNRTLVYAALTATLVGSYLIGVLAFGAVLRPLTGESDLAIAASTLLVAALFRPARSRIQHAVDRRFYRRKYDAERTIDEFAGRLRDQIDLDTLAAELRSTAGRTVQPSRAGIWLRDGGRG
ncbi:MAG: hypothetical protein ACR2NA_12345 [Solirubrobacterales bacterium]